MASIPSIEPKLSHFYWIIMQVNLCAKYQNKPKWDFHFTIWRNLSFPLSIPSNWSRTSFLWVNHQVVEKFRYKLISESFHWMNPSHVIIITILFLLYYYIYAPRWPLSAVPVPWFDWHDRQIDRQTYRVSSFFSFLKMSLEMLVTLFLLILRTSRDVRLSKQFDSNDAKLLLFTTLKSKIYIEFFSKIIVLVLAKLIL